VLADVMGIALDMVDEEKGADTIGTASFYTNSWQ